MTLLGVEQERGDIVQEYICYLSLGANLGDRLTTINLAINKLKSTAHIHAVRVSSMYETPPWGKLDQPAFINCALELRTTLEPHDLLHICQQIEKELGRVRHEHWGARTIDIDLLFIEHYAVADAELVLPHPYMLERSFVLVPLAELAPELRLANGLTASASRDLLPDVAEMKKLN